MDDIPTLDGEELWSSFAIDDSELRHQCQWTVLKKVSNKCGLRGSGLLEELVPYPARALSGAVRLRDLAAERDALALPSYAPLG